MLKFDYLVKNIEIFIGQFIMPFCFGRKNVQLEIVKINSELLKIKKIKQMLPGSFLKVVPARFSTFSQPAAAHHAANLAGSAPAFL